MGALSGILQPGTLMELASKVIDIDMRGKDQLHWLTPTGGSFSVKFTYDLLVGESDAGKWNVWKLIWRLRI